MEGWISSGFPLKTLDTLAHGGKKIKGQRDFDSMPKMIKQNEMMCYDPIKSKVQRNIFNDDP